MVDALKRIPASAILTVAPGAASQALKQAKDVSSGENENIFGVAGGIPYIAGGALLGYIYTLIDKALFGDVVP